MQTFSFNPPIYLVEEGNCFLGLSLLECKNFVFNITKANKSFSIIKQCHYQTELAEKNFDDLKKLLELRSLEIHVKEVRKRENKKKETMNKNYHFLIPQKNEKLEKLKNVNFNDLEDLVYRMQLTYDEIIDILDLKHIPTKRMGHSLSPGIYEADDLNNTLKNILPDIVKVIVTINDISLRSNLKVSQALIFTEKSFFYTISGFTRSRFYLLDDIDGFYQLIAGSYKSDKPINITRIDKIHLKCDCVNGSIVNGVREPILNSFALSSPPGHKIYKEHRTKLFKKINKSVMSHITFYLEDDDHKPVDFINETKSFTCQLVNISNSHLKNF